MLLPDTILLGLQKDHKKGYLLKKSPKYYGMDLKKGRFFLCVCMLSLLKIASSSREQTPWCLRLKVATTPDGEGERDREKKKVSGIRIQRT